MLQICPNTPIYGNRTWGHVAASVPEGQERNKNDVFFRDFRFVEIFQFEFFVLSANYVTLCIMSCC